MLPLYERSMRISRDKYLPSCNRGIQVPKKPTTIGGHLRRRRLQLKIVKYRFPVVPVERDQFIHRFPAGQPERDDAAGGRPREQICPLDQVGNLSLKAFQEGKRDPPANASSVQ